MPCKRRCENVVPANIPDFEQLMNFPLRVQVEDQMGNKKNMIMDGQLHLVPDEKNDMKCMINIEKQLSERIPNFEASGILKNSESNTKDTNNKENIKKSVRFSGVMFSSPIVKNAHDNTSDLRKKTLIEQLRKCQETPILPIKCKERNVFAANSLSQSTTDNLSVTPLFNHKTEISWYSLNKSDDDSSLQIVKVEDRKKWIIEAKRRSRMIKRAQGVNDSFWEIFNVDDSEAAVLKLCNNQSIETFVKLFPPKDRKNISKLGEGSFGEVFSLIGNNNQISVVKFVPVEGDLSYNNGPQTSFDDIISEIVVAKELSDLKYETLNKCKNFVQMKSVSVVIGKFPQYFQREWNKSNKIKTSENDNPKKFDSSQKWTVIQFEYAGVPLEDFNLESWDQAYSILIQTCLALACAENYLEFEHRDLHWGNLLILEKDKLLPKEEFIVDGKLYSIEHHGIQPTIIDFTFSRIKKNTNVVFTDLSKDDDIFLGKGDIQFDVYRQMKNHNKNEWASFNPKTNIFWLSYLGFKLHELLKTKENTFEIGKKSEFDRLAFDISKSKSSTELVKLHLNQ